jgi:DNA-binding protein H-NS
MALPTYDQLLKAERADLLALQKNVEKALHESQANERKDVLEALRQAAGKHGFTLDQLLGTGVGAAKSAGKARGEAKYAHPDNRSLTWSGRGRNPAWMTDHIRKGGKKDDLLIS